MYYNQPRNGNSAHESGTANCPCTAFASYYPQNRPILPPIPMPFILPRTLQERMHIPVPLPSPLAQIMHILLYSVTYFLHLANAWSGGFSFDCPIGQSIGELSPCVPRFCYYERDCFVSTQSRTKSTFFWGKSGNFSFCIKVNSRYSQAFPANIDSRILITVHLISTGATIHTVFQFQFLFEFSAAAADFWTGIPLIDTNQFLTGTF